MGGPVRNRDHGKERTASGSAMPCHAMESNLAFWFLARLVLVVVFARKYGY